MIKIMMLFSSYYLKRLNITSQKQIFHELFEPDILQKKAKDYGLSGNVFMSVKEALKRQKEMQTH